LNGTIKMSLIVPSIYQIKDYKNRFKIHESYYLLVDAINKKLRRCPNNLTSLQIFKIYLDLMISENKKKKQNTLLFCSIAGGIGFVEEQSIVELLKINLQEEIILEIIKELEKILIIYKINEFKNNGDILYIPQHMDIAIDLLKLDYKITNNKIIPGILIFYNLWKHIVINDMEIDDLVYLQDLLYSDSCENLYQLLQIELDEMDNEFINYELKIIQELYFIEKS